MIREFIVSDLERVLEIECKSFKDTWRKEEFEVIHKRCPYGFLVAQMNGRVIGYAIATVEVNLDFKTLRIARHGHILNLAVDEGYRKQGVGSNLIRSIVERLRERMVSKVYLEVRKSNQPAIKLYSRLNFKVEKVVKGYYPDGEDAYLMSKDLSSYAVH
ncbi:MAG: ribosomal protein S18-alanine N-acetyltransferase [Candidatus Bathyarchaeia archaeon]